MTVMLVVMPIFPFIVSMFIFVGRVTMIILVMLAIVFRHMFNMMMVMMGRILVIIITINVLVLMPSEMSVILF